MKRIICAAAFSLFAFACGGKSPEQACRDDAPVSCEKMWTCDASVKIGNDQASCVTQTQSLCMLAAGGCQDSTKTYHADKADECTAQTKAQTCEQYKAGKPAVCNEICS